MNKISRGRKKKNKSEKVQDTMKRKVGGRRGNSELDRNSVINSVICQYAETTDLKSLSL